MLLNILQFLMSRGATQTESDPPAEGPSSAEADADESANQSASPSPFSGLIQRFMNRRQAGRMQQPSSPAGRVPNGLAPRQQTRLQPAQRNQSFVQQPWGMQRGQQPIPYGPLMPPMQGLPRTSQRSGNPGMGRAQQQPMQPYGGYPPGGYPSGQAFGGGYGLPGVPMMANPNASKGGSRGRSRANPPSFPPPYTPYSPNQPYPPQFPPNRQNRNSRRGTPPFNPWSF